MIKMDSSITNCQQSLKQNQISFKLVYNGSNFLPIFSFIIQMKKDHLDVNNLADEPRLLDYEHKPVQNYGMSLLKGMGFSETNGIGKNKNNQLNDIYVLKPRPRGQGLGAETQEQQTKQKFQIGDKILITEQPHKGLTGQINSCLDDDHFSIELNPSKSIVKIDRKNLKKISKVEMKSIQNQFQKNKDQNKKKRRLKWVVPQIRVKVTDPKSIYYLKKLIVSDLISQRQFQCRDQVGKTVSNLSEQDLQTVIPKNGGSVIILRGSNKNSKGVVIDRKKSKGLVTVQTNQQLQIIKVDENDISQYVQI